MKKQITNVKPGWVDYDLLQRWTKGGEVLFSKEDERRGCYWVVVEFVGTKTLQLQRYFQIGDRSEISADVICRGEDRQDFLVEVLDRIVR
jgi:hypothetical protein